jgi:hypothetical protein
LTTDLPIEVTTVNRVAALIVLTATFAPAAVMGAMPLVLAFVVLLTLGLLLTTTREPSSGLGSGTDQHMS